MLMSISAAARETGINKGTIHRAVEAGKIPSQRDGAKVLIEADGLRERIAEAGDPMKARGADVAPKSLTAAKTEAALIDVQRKRLAHARELGQVVDAQSVAQAVEDVARDLRVTFERDRPSLAAELAGMDSAAIEERLKRRDDDAFNALVAAFGDAIGG